MNARSDPAVIDLDVRPYFASGTPPIGAIMEAVEHLPAGASLRLIAPFEPTPLLHRLGAQGFDHRVRQRDDGAVEVLFSPRSAPESNPIVLDLRDLEPPLPMQRALEALELLAPGQRLITRTRFRPVHLLEVLDTRGVPAGAEEQSDGSWTTEIVRSGEGGS